MAKRNYKIKDVCDYLLEYYNLEWRLCLVLDDGMERGVRNFDFGGKYGTRLSVVAVVYQGSRRKVLPLSVTNNDLSIGYGFNKPQLSWAEYLVLKHHEEKTL